LAGMMLTCNSCVAVKTLPLNTDVEIECIAVL
jgi:enamine deaminase RidA (YjgF/YER057c/UK114 family)